MYCFRYVFATSRSLQSSNLLYPIGRTMLEDGGETVACNGVGSSFLTDQEGNTFYMEYELKDLSVKLGDCVRIKLETDGLENADNFAFGQVLAIYIDAERDFYIEVRWFLQPHELSSRQSKIIAPQENELIESGSYINICPAGSVTEIIDIQGIDPNKRLNTGYFICRFMVHNQSSSLTKVSPHSILKRGMEFTPVSDDVRRSSRRRTSDSTQPVAVVKPEPLGQTNTRSSSQGAVLQANCDHQRSTSQLQDTNYSVQNVAARSVAGNGSSSSSSSSTSSSSSSVGGTAGTIVRADPGLTAGASATNRYVADSAIRSASEVVARVQDSNDENVVGGNSDIPVTHVYLGIYRFGTGNGNTSDESTDRSLFIRVEDDKCVLSSQNRTTGESLETEDLTFKHIKKITCALTKSDSNHGFISFEVLASLNLCSVGVGVNCMLHPGLAYCDNPVCAKNILVLLDITGLRKFYNTMCIAKSGTRTYNGSLGFSHFAATRFTDEYLFAHQSCGQHQIAELRSRARRELDLKKEKELRRLQTKRSRCSSTGTSSASVLPTDTAAAVAAITPLPVPDVGASITPGAKNGEANNGAAPADQLTTFQSAATTSAPVHAHVQAPVCAHVQACAAATLQVPLSSTPSVAPAPPSTLTAAPSVPPLPPPPPLSSKEEYAVWQSKRDRDIAEIKNTLRDKVLCALLSQSEIDSLKSRLVQLMLQ